MRRPRQAKNITNRPKNPAVAGMVTGGGTAIILPQPQHAVLRKTFGGRGMILLRRLHDQVIGDDHHTGNKTLAGGAGIVAFEHRRNATDLVALEADIDLL